MSDVHVVGEPLFWGEELRNFLQDCTRNITQYIERLLPERVSAYTDEELTEMVFGELAPIPIVLEEDNRTADDVKYVEEQIQNYGMWITAKTQVYRIRIPWTGSANLWRCKPNSIVSVVARGRAETYERGRGHLILELKGRDGVSPELFAKALEEQLTIIRKYVDNVNKMVETYQEEIPSLVAEIAANYRGRVSHSNNVLEALGIPLKSNPNAPQPQPIVLKPALKRSPNKQSVGIAVKAEPEYTIKSEDYEHIIKVLRHVGRTFERLPRTFVKFDEEELRDVLLAHLNGHYEGEANGEAFRGEGKTDICLEFKNRAAFVGECKIWSGPGAVQSAVSQMLGYTTWRDAKTALVIFNKNVKDFSSLLPKTIKALKEHELFVREHQLIEHGEWRVEFKAFIDNPQSVICHVFLLDLSRGQ